MCSSEQAKITSACGCYLSGAPTSTVTVYETVSATYTETTVTVSVLYVEIPEDKC